MGTAGVVDPIGGELVKENATLQAFFAPGGGSAVLRQRRLADLRTVARRQGPHHDRESTLWTRAEHRGRTGAVGSRRPAGVDRIDQHQGRRRLQEGQEDDLLWHAAEKVPQGRVPGEVGNHVRDRRNRDHRYTRRPAPRSSRTPHRVASGHSRVAADRGGGGGGRARSRSAEARRWRRPGPLEAGPLSGRSHRSPAPTAT